MEIERTTFGTITIDGKTYEHDVIIRLSGEVARRKKKLSKKYYGTSHVLSKDEAKFVFENGCEQLMLGTGRSEAPRRGDGDPGASAGALASNPLPWWDKLTMNVSLWVRFTATERRERGAARRVLIEPSLDDPCTVLCVIDRAPKPPAADGKLSEVS